jgi:hypothetical protein
LVVVICVLGLAACGSSSKKSSGSGNTSGTSPQNFQVQTPEGQVSLSLNGHLPPNWPANFPVPSDAKPAGSGSLANDSSGYMVAVYDSSQSPSDVFNFYKTNASLTVSSSRSAGVGSAYVGTISLGGDNAGSSVVVTSSGSGSRIIVTLKGGSASSTTTANVTTTTNA